MTQKQKDILLKDLCGRLPYRVKCKTLTQDINGNDIVYEDKEELTIYRVRRLGNEYMTIIPYLFPLSSMTEEQCYDFYCRFVENEIDYDDFKEYYFDDGLWHKVLTSIYDCSEVIDWFNKNHFDYRGLIKKGLAIDATGLNIY